MTVNEETKTTKRKSASLKEKKKLSLALQGGGAHGAFTWGVLDRLLQDPRIEIEGVTGTSAGGMNALCLTQGLATGGAEGARQLLRTFWESISEMGKNNPINSPSFMDKILGKRTMNHSPGYMTFNFLRNMFSPYQLNPRDVNPLRDLIIKLFNFEILNTQNVCKAYLCATHITTGKIKVFAPEELTVDALLATACVPTIHHAAKVDGEYYWDGGFIGNPVLYPLIYNCQSPDIMIVKLTPSVRNELPKTSEAIENRLFEITNNATMAREIRAINFITQLIDNGELDVKKHRRLYVHTVEDDETFLTLGRSSTVNTTSDFLTFLFQKGSQAAEEWLQNNYESLGVRSTTHIGD